MTDYIDIPAAGAAPGALRRISRPAFPPSPKPLRVVPICPHQCADCNGCGQNFNCSVLRHRDKLLMAYREGWNGANIRIVELDDALKPSGNTLVSLHHPRSHAGRDDPRLFSFGGKLHLGFGGVELRAGRVVAHQLVARLGEDFQAQEVWEPEYAPRNEWEKNWGFFEWAGELFAVYTIQPHVVLHLVGQKAYPFAAAPANLHHLWSGGLLRGGAAPVRVGAEYWSFFHGVRQGPRWTYTMGLYTFAAQPPFRPLRLVPDPLVLPDPKDCPHHWHCDVVYPCGAVLQDATWRVSFGYHDHWCRIAEFSHEQLEKALVPC